MISYELARELKDAGFPQRGYGNGITHSGCPHWMTDEHGKCDCFAYPPTLSELIEACTKDGFFQLRNDTLTVHWHCSRTYADGTRQVHSGNGDTPEEAVARLWLALNKK